tara:strand:- start:260 stop:2224 length:1965 start_codon:yes stop_codon:yes gene_type:complete
LKAKILKEAFLLIVCTSFVFANQVDMNGAVNSNFGNSYGFYDFSENILDLNIFYNDLQGWIQYEYSNPPDIGFGKNDIRKFRLEYSTGDFILKLGDLYEFWGRGLLLNQFDDQVTNFDNGTRGMLIEYDSGSLSASHMNGNSSIWNMGADTRTPEYNNIHSMMANRLEYNRGLITLGLTQLRSNEEHDVNFGPSVFVSHDLKGAYATWASGNADLFVEYVDKVSTEKVTMFGTIPNDTLLKGHGYYQNFNFYFGNWGISTEYKRYAFDRAYGDITSDDYGNQIEYQQMPTLGKEHNSTLLGRLTHNYNFNDERGAQVEVNGSLLGLSLTAQYAHLSRNETWQSVGSFEWTDKAIEGFLPSSDISALPYWENYQEVSGYAFNDKFYFKLGRGSNKEILKTIRYFEGTQVDISSVDTSLTWVYDTLVWNDETYFDSTEVELYDTNYTSPFNVESKLWQESKAFTIPLEVNYIFDNGYTLGLGFQYQEREKVNRSKGNATTFNASDSSWTMYDPDDYSNTYDETVSQLANPDGAVKTQYNRLVYFSISKAPKWSFTITHDMTNAYEASSPYDPYYNPLEALISGDLKYFTGKRNNIEPPSWIQNRWVSVEFAYNITSSQRLSIMYGSIQGGLFCSNGVCRLIPPFNDGVKISYSASF